MSYAGRLAVIGGGLGGLGSSIAQALYAKGAHVALFYAPFEAERRQKVLTEVFGTQQANISTVECDITSEASVGKAFATVSDHAGSLNLSLSMLINAAGYVTVQPLAETSVDEAQKNMLVNIMGPLLCSQAFYRNFVKQKEKPPGRIVSISSQASHVALDGHGPYCASKAGLNSLTRCMALEWGPAGITSNTVSPTVVLTELGKRAWSDAKKRAAMEQMIPTGRFAVPEEIASAVEYLCQDGAGMINGADVRIDGGFTIR